MNFRTLVSAGVTVAILFAVAIPALAAAPAPVNNLPGGTAITVTDIVTLIENIVNRLIEVSMVIVIGVMVWAGVTMATSDADGARYKKGKAMLFNAIIATVVILGVGVILNTIQSFVNKPTGIL